MEDSRKAAEWCFDCKEYDQERHCCPRFNRVIRNTVEEIKAEHRWIPVTERLPEKFQACIVTDERRQCAYEYDYNPENEFTKKYGWRCSGRKIVAWMPLPEPYEGEKIDETD